MVAAFRRLKPRALRGAAARRRRTKSAKTRADWKTLRTRDFLKEYRSVLEIRGTCDRCCGPVSESMRFCPWCGAERHVAPEESRFKDRCPRCRRSMKTDWRYCPWCYGAAVNASATPRHSDFRYVGRCSNARCTGKDLMPFMRYCPWCHRKVRHPWKIEGSKDRCPRCDWGVLADYWDHCPWCGRSIRKR